MMNQQLLSTELDIASKYGAMNGTEIPSCVLDNLSSKIKLRPYQIEAIKRYIFQSERHKNCLENLHLLYHMATGSGKTVIMAALILYLYKKGYRNFLFFVNSDQIINKTKDNFLNPFSQKYLFSQQIKIDGNPVEIHSVDNFNTAPKDSININFITVQGLHSKIQNPSENALISDDFANNKVVLISDESHHINTITKSKLSAQEITKQSSWENTVNKIVKKNSGNVLLEFTATINLENEKILKKYSNKLIYDYSLKQFREDGYTKDVILRKVPDLTVRDRMLSAILISQLRRKIAGKYKTHLKPVILMKSKTIQDSLNNETEFNKIIRELTPDELIDLKSKTDNDPTLIRFFNYVLKECGINFETLCDELKEDFSQDKVVNVNKLTDLEKLQKKLNTLEDPNNKIRVIFAVNKLDEGWDVLNLYDIVRLFDTQRHKTPKINKTTISEAQLIGRGARYFPFSDLTKSDVPSEKRKYDNDLNNPLRMLEEIYYHCPHDPAYVKEISEALCEKGLIDSQIQTVQLRIKDEFKNHPLYKNGLVWVNRKHSVDRKEAVDLGFYKISNSIEFPIPLLNDQFSEISAFDINNEENSFDGSNENICRQTRLSEFNQNMINFVIDRNNFYRYSNLKKYFPALKSLSQFKTNDSFLAGISVKICGLSENIVALTKQQELNIIQYVLSKIQVTIEKHSSEYTGSYGFDSIRINDCFKDKTIKLRINGESGKKWSESNIHRTRGVNLALKKWYVYQDNCGSDQEKYLILFINDYEKILYETYDEFFLLRNEKAVKLFNFANGTGFEPDFLLLLQKGKEIRILFIEPKGSFLKEKDEQKEQFLKEIKAKAKLSRKNQEYSYEVYGLPFFNESEPTYSEFRTEFEKFL